MSSWVEETIAELTRQGWWARERTWSLGESVCFASSRFEVNGIGGLKNGGYLYRHESEWFAYVMGTTAVQFPDRKSAVDWVLNQLSSRTSSEEKR